MYGPQAGFSLLMFIANVKNENTIPPLQVCSLPTTNTYLLAVPVVHQYAAHDEEVELPRELNQRIDVGLSEAR